MVTALPTEPSALATVPLDLGTVSMFSHSRELTVTISQELRMGQALDEPRQMLFFNLSQISWRWRQSLPHSTNEETEA